MTTATLLTVISVVGGFLITAAGAIATWAVLRTGRQAGVLANLKEAADSATRVALARKEEIDEQQRHIEKLEKDNTTKDKQIANLGGRVQQLSDLVTGRPEWAQLTASFAMITQHMDTRISEALAQADQIRADIRAVREAVEKNAKMIKEENNRGATHRGGQRADQQGSAKDR